jgi:hypothetical protein
MMSEIEAQDTMESKSSVMNTDEDCENAPGMLVLSRTCSLVSHYNVDDSDDDFNTIILAGFPLPPRESPVTSFDGTILIPDRCGIDDSIGQLDATKQNSKISNKKPRKKDVCKKRSENWRSMCSLAKAYNEENGGHWKIPRTDHRLGNWIRRQRQQYRNKMAGKKSPMTSGRITILNEIHFEWEPREATWKLKFHALRQFWIENRHTHVPSTREFDNLNKWCNRQKERFWENGMDHKRFIMLDAIDFEWEKNADKVDDGDE